MSTAGTSFESLGGPGIISCHVRAALLCAGLGDERVTERTLCSGSARPTSIRMPDYERVCVAGVRLIMSLSCWICGSGSAREDGWLVSEGEQGEGDERFGSVEAECDSGEESDLGVGRLDEGVGEP